MKVGKGFFAERRSVLIFLSDLIQEEGEEVQLKSAGNWLSRPYPPFLRQDRRGRTCLDKENLKNILQFKKEISAYPRPS